MHRSNRYLAIVASLVAMTCGTGLALRSWDLAITDGASRFSLVLNSQAVRDTETRLVWERQPDNDPSNLSSAAQACADKTTGDRGGWRLPTVSELQSLLDATQTSPALSPNHPFINVNLDTTYWALTPDVGLTNNPERYWAQVSIENGSTDSSVDPTTDLLRSWCVRSFGR